RVGDRALGHSGLLRAGCVMPDAGSPEHLHRPSGPRRREWRYRKARGPLCKGRGSSPDPLQIRSSGLCVYGPHAVGGRTNLGRTWRVGGAVDDEGVLDPRVVEWFAANPIAAHPFDDLSPEMLALARSPVGAPP